MKQLLQAYNYILEHGEHRNDRTGVGTIGVFGYQMRFDLQQGFPAVTTKKLAWRSVVSELLWFIEGSTDERRLAEILYGTRDPQKTTIWTANAQADYWKDRARFPGDLGPVYGKQFRDFNGVDQIAKLVETLKKDPQSRRHIISLWNAAEVDEGALPPCHVLSQYYVSNGKLSCQLYQRSVDSFLGLAFNIASYALLTHMLAQVCGLEVGEFIHTSGDMHIYKNHIEAVKEQLQREPLKLATLKLNSDVKDIFKFTMDDIELVDYQHHPAIQASMAV